ncbi:MAG: DUF58 domain-containing protein [Propionibacteriaceae bacterium]|nr:DUF58 domain-containing protein [Propionibacteriaceae bacterium]
MTGGIRPLRGVWVLGPLALLMTVAAGLWGSVPLLVAGTLLLTAVLGDGALLWWRCRRAQVPPVLRQIEPNPGQPGQAVTVQLRFVDEQRSGTSWMTGDLSEQMPPALSRRANLLATSPAAAAGRSSLSYQVWPPHRGDWPLGPVTAPVVSALGLWWATLVGHSVDQLRVWPALRQLSLPGRGVSPARSGALALVEQRADNALLRPYVPGDDLRRIHWRSSARLGQWMTRAEEGSSARRAWIGLRVESNSDLVAREAAVSLAATLLVSWSDQGYVPSLSVGGQLLTDDYEALLGHLATISSQELARPLVTGRAADLSGLVLAGRPDWSVMAADPVTRGSGGAGGSSRVAVLVNDSDSTATAGLSAAWPLLTVDPAWSLERMGQSLELFWHRQVLGRQ